MKARVNISIVTHKTIFICNYSIERPRSKRGLCQFGMDQSETPSVSAGLRRERRKKREERKWIVGLSVNGASLTVMYFPKKHPLMHGRAPLFFSFFKIACNPMIRSLIVPGLLTTYYWSGEVVKIHLDYFI